LKGYRAQALSGTVTARNETRLHAELERHKALAAGASFTIPNLHLEMVSIAAGSFTMGSPATELKHEKNESPQTEVTFTRRFWLGATEVTQGQYEAVMGNNPSKFKAAGNRAPVENVTWIDAMEFCRRLTERARTDGRLPDGYAFSLPTEAQWEYACRAGTTSAYAGDLDRMAWHEDNRDASGKTTHQVAQKKPNAWGLFDMHGNVAEWCADYYSDKLPGGSVTDYTGPANGSRRVYRGGSWDHSREECRSAVRVRTSPTSRSDYLGFRVALVEVK
jgi:formylglycine-generating enzyme required for sulfatase activity